jgi:hypothetical protein
MNILSLSHPIIQKSNLEDIVGILDTISHTSVTQFITQQQDIIPTSQNLKTQDDCSQSDDQIRKQAETSQEFKGLELLKPCT